MNGFILTDRTIEQLKRVEEGFMDYTCLRERATTVVTDDRGQDVPADWQVLPDRIPCSFNPSPAGNRASIGGYQEYRSNTADYVEIGPKLKMPLGTDVKLTDRIVDIRDRHDSPVEPFRFEITSVTPRRASLTLMLKAEQ